MAKVMPKVVNDIDSLERVVKNNEKVIIITNKNLFPSIKKKVSKMSKERKNSNKGLAGGSLLLAGSMIAEFVFLAGGWTVMIPAMVGFGLIGSSASSKLLSIKKNLKNYTYTESDNRELLILVKEIGKNKFDFANDSIDYESIKK